MLPIIPNSKKATSTRKKRPRILPSASASSKKKKSNIIKQPTSKASATSLKDDTATATQDNDTAQKQHEPINVTNNTNNNSNVNEEDDTLLLAAEAAAALMDEIPNSLPNNSTTNNNNGTDEGNVGGNNNNGGGLDYADIPMNLLDEVNNSVEYAASMMTKEQLQLSQKKQAESEVKEKEATNNITTKEKEGGLKVPSLPPIQYNNNVQTTSTNPLGNEVISFTSKLPEQQQNESTMSTVQKNFLNHYYYNGLNESGDKSVLLNGNNSSLKRVGDKDTGEDDEEIVEEDGTTTATKQKKGKENKKDGEEPSLPSEEEGATAGKEAVALTLRTVCASIPRTIKKKNKNNNKNLKLKNEGENIMIMEEEEAAAMGTADKETAATTGQDKAADKVQAPTAEEAATEESTTETATGPQVKVNEQGEIVIEQESLLPNPETRQSTAQIDQELGNTVIDEGETPSQLGAIQARYDSYTSQPRQVPTRWSVTETKSFYRALRQCGSDFSMMEMFLVGRTRSQLKRKFKIESRKNARLIDMALNPRQKVKLDLSVFGDNLVIPTEVPAIKVLPPLEEDATLGKAAGKGGQKGTEKRKSMEKSFDHLFQEEDGDDTAIANDGDEIDESVQKGKSDEVPAQATAVVPPVIAAAKSTTSKTKAKKAFKPKVKKPKKMTKKTASVKK